MDASLLAVGKKHHPMLHPIEVNEERSAQPSANVDAERSQGRPVSSPPLQSHNAQTGHCGATGTVKKRVCLRVIPVKILAGDGNEKRITYAIRDEGSNTTLIKESLAKDLRLSGKPVDFQLTTMNGVSQESGKSYAFYVQGIGEKDYQEIPSALSVKDLSIANSCIPAEQDIAKWLHFEGIPEVTILIGADVPEAHWKLEERRGRKKEPYAVRTPLGWSVAGSLGTDRCNDVSSFHIRQEVGFLSDNVDQMFRMDFSESLYSPDLGVSLEDQKALAIMETSLKVVDGHYHLDLPFRTKTEFPDNKSLAQKRLNSLKLRLKTSTTVEYNIDEYVNKGYAANIDQSRLDDADPENAGKWYLPHHPVIPPPPPPKAVETKNCL